MKVLVVNVAAETSGALTILKQYYHVLQEEKRNEYVLCVGRSDLSSRANVKVLHFPWVKRSWLHRLWFEYVTAPRLAKNLQIDEILSLQNTAVPRVRLPQTIYLHQPLPFTEVRFKFRDEPKFWVYQNIIGKIIVNSLKKANRIIVQTTWMKDAVMQYAGVSPERITIQPPELKQSMISRQFSEPTWKLHKRFIYPATAFKYKDHLTLFRAMAVLRDLNISDFEVLLTLDETSLPASCRKLYKTLQKQTTLLGIVPREDLLDYMGQSVLVFPSYIETLGLPLLEARLCESPVIAADTPFAKELLAGYEKASFFPVKDHNVLAEHMKKIVSDAAD